MLHDDHQEKIGRFARGIIRRKVHQLIHRAGFTKQDREDLEQELVLRLLQALPSFDSAKAHRNVFITTVIERCAANVLRNNRAQKRDHRRVSSLHVMVDIGEDEKIELAQTISQRELDARRGRHPRSDEELAELAIDLASVIATLPKSWRTLVERRRTQTMPEIANEMGVPRTTLNEWMRRIRVRCEKTGLKDYL